MKNNEVLAQVKTQSLPYGVEYTRLWKRHIDGRVVYTVCTNNNCIQANYSNLAEAVTHYDRITKETK